MSIWCNMTQEQGQLLANLVSSYRPFIGSKVKVMFEGAAKKHQGKTGIVFFHGVDKFNKNAFRYGSDASFAMREVRGRYGYRIGIKSEDGEKFFVSADSVMVEIERTI